MSAAANPNLAARLFARAARHPARAAFVGTHGGTVETVSFAELVRRIAAFSAALRRRGVGPGDRVLLFVPMSVELYVALLGIHHAGAAAVFVDAWAGRRRLEDAVAAARPRAFVGTARAHLLRLASAAMRAIPVAILARRGLGARGAASGAAVEALVAPAAVAAGDAALVTFTTGSTGRPKAAARSHAFLWAQHEILSVHLGQREGDVDMPTLPIFVLNNLAGGIPSVLPDFDPRRPAAIRPAAILAQMRAATVTTASGSPAFFERLCRHAKASGAALPLRAFFTGGAPVPPALARAFAECCAASGVLYGSTEAEPIASIPSAELVSRTAEAHGAGLCAGRPIPEIELRIARPADGPIELGPGGWEAWRVPPGEPGEIVVAGPHVLPGYLDDPASDRENKVREGNRVWHRTGDGGFLDAAGRLWLTGRVGQRVRRAGATWWPLPIELRALEVPGVAHAAYLGLPDATLGQRAMLCVETASGALPAETERALKQAATPAPVDALIALRRIPRDPRHASKTDVGALMRRIEGRA